jgi:GntR family transcriptional regulator
VAELTRNGLLDVLPGVGTVVSGARASNGADRSALLAKPLEALLVEAKRLGLQEEEVMHAVHARWTELFGDDATGHRGEANGA